MAPSTPPGSTSLKSTFPKTVFRLILGAAFVLVGIAHFVKTASFVAIMPPYLPAHEELVDISGVFEVLGGLGLLIPTLQRWAGFGLIALLIAVFPANIHMAMSPELFLEWGIPLWLLYARLPLQFVLIYAVWWSAISQTAKQAR